MHARRLVTSLVVACGALLLAVPASGAARPWLSITVGTGAYEMET